jgi:hypothetical protein
MFLPYVCAGYDMGSRRRRFDPSKFSDQDHLPHTHLLNIDWKKSDLVSSIV